MKRHFLLSLTIALAGMLLPTPAAASFMVPDVFAPGTYNSTSTTSGVGMGDDSLYDGNAGFPSYTTNGHPTGNVWKLITVTTESVLAGVSGNGTKGSEPTRSITFPSWTLTVDPANISTATSNPTLGSIGNEDLILASFENRGLGFWASTTRNYDVLLTPSGASPIVLQPGQYYVSVLANFATFPDPWVWTELVGTGESSDLGWVNGITAPGESIPAQGFTTFGGRTMQTGVIGYDVWLTPTTVPTPTSFGAMLFLGSMFGIFRLRHSRTAHSF